MIVVQSVDRDATDPAHGIVVLLDSSPVRVGLHESLLHRVGCDFTIAAGQCERTNESPVMGAKQRVDGRDDLRF